MKIKYIKLQNWLIAGVMSLFGLSACHSHKDVIESDNKPIEGKTIKDREPAKLMYGGPERDYNVLKAVENKNVVVEPREPQVTVYGVPTADFAIKGRVVNSSGKPIKGLQVALLNRDFPEDAIPPKEEWNDSFVREVSDTTDANGAFEIRANCRRPWDEMKVLVRDIDGAKNGKYQQQMVDVEFGEPKSDDESGNKWRQGVKYAEITVKMKVKK